MYTLTETADYLSKFVAKYDGGKKFKIISETGGKGLPLVAWSIRPESGTKWDEFALARGLRQKGWIVSHFVDSDFCTFADSFHRCLLTLWRLSESRDLLECDLKLMPL